MSVQYRLGPQLWKNRPWLGPELWSFCINTLSNYTHRNTLFWRIILPMYLYTLIFLHLATDLKHVHKSSRRLKTLSCCYIRTDVFVFKSYHRIYFFTGFCLVHILWFFSHKSYFSTCISFHISSIGLYHQRERSNQFPCISLSCHISIMCSHRADRGSGNRMFLIYIGW